ncbi:sodium-dependent transporter [Oceanicoccus sagamiensis]|uniref:Sodium-dependent transporter n=1 Tax=Oceanicoccus sagamiensis TaxID=716816 RepID=A0A1X9N873_9GAMM|nr:sodium-dependent transporter [Oceanicoccus sagamiensis]ARN73294.1 sodium-dependent transporter [Oceanicoccus sagamiensis]
MNNHYESRRRGWRRSWSFVAATTGATIGLGNLWKFSYLAGENGGAAFVLAYLICIVVVAMPVMIAEVVLGSRGRSNPVSTMRDVSLEAGASSAWQVIGWLGCIAGLLVLSYYSVIAGWGFAYIGKLLGGEFVAASAQLSGDSFNSLLAAPELLVQWQALFLLIILLVVALGVRRGISAAARLLLPLLFIMLIALAIYSSQVGDFKAAAEFLFKPDFSALSQEALLVALGHAFFTLSIGVGAMMAYGAYVPDQRSITGMVSTVVLMDTLVSILAGLAIFPLVFSLNMAPAMGPGLMFVAMPYGFGNMIYGNYFGALFFLMVSLAAITSGVALLEPATSWLAQQFRWWRPAAAVVMIIVVWLLGLVTIFSFNIWQHIEVFGMSVFNLLDFVTANLLLPIGGVLIALFVGWKMRKEVLRDELYVESPQIFWLWRWLLRYIAAPGVLVVFLWSLYPWLKTQLV